MLQVSLPLMGIAGRYVPQNLELGDTSCLECAQQLSRDRRAYTEAERWVQVRANRRLVPQTAFPHCRHSQLEPFRSFGQTACGYGRRRPQVRQTLRSPEKQARRRAAVSSDHGDLHAVDRRERVEQAVPLLAAVAADPELSR